MMKFRSAAVLLFALIMAGARSGYAAPPTPAPDPAPAQTQPAPAAPAIDNTLPSVPVPQFPESQAKLSSWKTTLDGTEASLHNQSIEETALTALADQIAEVQQGARDLIAETTPLLEAAEARAAQLAPDPKATAPQSDEVKLERAKLLAEVAARQSLIQQANLINVRAEQAFDKITDRRRSLFADSILRPTNSLINPSFWVTVGAAIPQATSRVGNLFSEWSKLIISQPLRSGIVLLMAALMLVIYFVSPWRRWQTRWTTRSPEIEEPGEQRKARAAMVIVLTGAAIPAIAMLVLYQAMTALGLFTTDMATIVRSLFVVTAFALLFANLATATLAPGSPSWSLINLGDDAARAMTPITVSIALITVIGALINTTNIAIRAPTELSIATTGLTTIIRALLVMIALRIMAGTDDDDDQSLSSAKRSAWRLLIPVGWIVAAAALLGPLAGYVAFGRFAESEILVVVTVLMGYVLLSEFADAGLAAAFAFNGALGRFLRQGMGLRTPAIRQVAALLGGALQLLLIALAAFLILATWGLRTDDLLASTSSAFFSVTVGKFTISPSAILGAIALLIIGMLATRAIQSWLERRFLPETSLDDGVRNSIRTGVGYLGVVLAALVAFSYVGLNLQNVAIVAGALSVGIGFGLQSIINNFVSGLILLVERPIKVGDRIEVGSRMGVVKRINVRATEIVTYDNVSVIVPNGDLISGQVVNWMHGSFTARLSVPVGVSYDTDPDKVIALLLEIAAAHPRILKNPGPFANLSSFGMDALTFTLFFHVGNIGTDGGVPDEIRLAILKRFRKESIDISPTRDVDVHLQNINALQSLIRDARVEPQQNPS